VGKISVTDSRPLFSNTPVSYPVAVSNGVVHTDDVFTTEQWNVASVVASGDPYHDGHGGSPDTEFSDDDSRR
jgi:hypothetical protein